MNEAAGYQQGQWIIHKHYGVGQIQGVEKKAISGEATRYYKVRSEKTTYWVPVRKVGNGDLFRPPASADEGQRVLDILSRPARSMNTDYKKRRKRIKEVTSEHSLLAIARLVRDLAARQADKRLNKSEIDALHDLKDRLLDEWALAMGWERNEAQSKLQTLLP
jgi:CarD family transcriptional regulator